MSQTRQLGSNTSASSPFILPSGSQSVKVLDIDGALVEGDLKRVVVPVRSFLASTHNPAPQDEVKRRGSEINQSINIQNQNLSRFPLGDPGRTLWLASLGISFLRRYELLNKHSDILDAVYYLRDAVKFTGKGDICLRIRLESLALSLFYRFSYARDRGEVIHLNQAIKFQREAIQLTPECHMKFYGYTYDLGRFLFRRYQHLHELPDLNESIAQYYTAACSLSIDSPDGPEWFQSLGSAHTSRFISVGDPDDLDQAINFSRKGLETTPDDHINKPRWLNAMADLLHKRFGITKRYEDFDEAIACQVRSHLIAKLENAGIVDRLSSLGDAHLSRFERMGDLDDLQHAVSYQEHVLPLTPIHHPSHPKYLSALGNTLQKRFERLGNPTDLDISIECLSKALALIPEGHESVPEYLGYLGNSYRQRFERFGELGDIDTAVERLGMASYLTCNEHPEKPRRLESLGESYRQRFEHTGQLADLDFAITCHNQAVLLTPNDHIARSKRLDSLGNSYRQRFERFAELADVDMAIEALRHSIALTPDNHADRPRRLDSLGNSHRRRFERMGVLMDIDLAISNLTQAVSLTPDDHADKARRFDSLGNAHRQRFERLDDLRDLDQAVSNLSHAVSLTPEGHADKARRIDSLGNAYIHRFQRLRELSDLDAAICWLEQSVALTPGIHADRARRIVNLGSAYSQRFERLKEIRDLGIAINFLGQAVGLTPDGHPDKAGRLESLGNAYRCRFEQTSENSEAEISIDCLIHAVQLTPENHPDRSRRYYNLSRSLQSRFERLRSFADISQAIDALQNAALSMAGSPFLRFQYARSWAKLAFQHSSASALDAYRVAMSLLPQVVWLGADVDQRHENARFAGDIATEAAAVAIASQKYELALEWLEEGTSIMWKQLLQLRTPLDELRLVDPTIASQLETIAKELERISLDNDQLSLGPVLGEQTSQHRRRLAEEWEQLVSSVRSLPSFGNFLRPKKVAELSQAARSGPVVVINVHTSRCDALILLPNSRKVSHLPLLSLSYGMCQDLRVQLARLMGNGGVRMTPCEDIRLLRRPMLAESYTTTHNAWKTMEILWNHVVEPVLGYLGYVRTQSQSELPHITWRATGPLVFVPLHGAGYYEDITKMNLKTYNYVVSSYTSSLTALLVPPPHLQNFNGILAVGQASAAGYAPLPGVDRELNNATQYFGKWPLTRLDDELATVSSVLEGMRFHSWIHLACHAMQNTDRPMTSAFYLHGGSLDIATISRESFKQKGLAFLSACQTATGDKDLPEEAIHLASGMLVAGYPTIIGTMWSIRDEDAPIVSDLVYTHLLQEGKPDCTKAAAALHFATASLRDKIGERELMRWLPFIHYGI